MKQTLVRVSPADLRRSKEARATLVAAKTAPAKLPATDHTVVAPTPAVAPVARARKAPVVQPRLNKSELVRSMPADLSADEVVASAAKHGVRVSRALVYLVRSNRAPARGPGRAPRAASLATVPQRRPDEAGAARRPAALRTTSSPPLTDREKELAALVLELGLGRVEELVLRLRHAIDRV